MSRKRCPQLGDGMEGCITIEKNGRTLDFFPGEVSADRITAIQVLSRALFSGSFRQKCLMVPFFDCAGGLLEHGICTI